MNIHWFHVLLSERHRVAHKLYEILLAQSQFLELTLILNDDFVYLIL
jgi:hypothetical protein